MHVCGIPRLLVLLVVIAIFVSVNLGGGDVVL